MAIHSETFVHVHVQREDFAEVHFVSHGVKTHGRGRKL